MRNDGNWLPPTVAKIARFIFGSESGINVVPHGADLAGLTLKLQNPTCVYPSVR